MSGRKRRIVVPGRGLAGAGAVVLALALMSLAWPALGAVWRAALATIAVIALVDFLVRPRRGQIAVRRELAHDLVVGRGGRYRLTLSHEGTGALHVAIRDFVPSALEVPTPAFAVTLAPGEEWSTEIAFECLERGVFGIGPATLRVRRPFGLLAYQEEAGAVDDARVLPGRPAGETAALLTHAQVMAEMGDRKLRLRGNDREFESLREYVVGDEYRNIDWKATARRRKPQVRQFQVERNAEILLGIDCGRLMGTLVHGVRKLDLAMTPLLDLAAVALKRKDRVGVLAFDSAARAYLPPRGGVAQLGRIRDALAGIDASFDPTSYTRALLPLSARRRKRSLVVLLTDFTDEISGAEMMEVLASMCRRHVLVFCAVSDPQLHAVLTEEPQSAAAAYQKGVAADLLVERRRLITRLNRMGAYTVDAEPDRLSAPLINRFLEARLRAF
ncbi:MAG: DUF58 domain-containing protein [Planctomycetota bacterium]|jgi:uncharacterized protein (DUF58 family)